MLAKVRSFGILGLEAYPVMIEVDVGRGLPSITIVGLPDDSIRESKERVRSAIKNSGFSFPSSRIIINLSPADVKKEGPSFDLAIALGILAASEQINPDAIHPYAYLGELSLDGRLQAVSGALAISTNRHVKDLSGIVFPIFNAKEASISCDIPIIASNSLKEVVYLTHNNCELRFQEPYSEGILKNPHEQDTDFADVQGQAHVKRGLEIAAAGGHNCLSLWTQVNIPGLNYWMVKQGLCP